MKVGLDFWSSRIFLLKNDDETRLLARVAVNHVRTVVFREIEIGVGDNMWFKGSEGVVLICKWRESVRFGILKEHVVEWLGYLGVVFNETTVDVASSKEAF